VVLGVQAGLKAIKDRVETKATNSSSNSVLKDFPRERTCS
jgi:hypothetical protein